MSCKIAFITSQYLCQPTRDALQRIMPEADYTVIPYDNFTHITQIYEHYADSYDGFMISGQSAMNIIELSSTKPIKPMASFQIDTASLYKALLQLCLRDRNLDLNRVYMDATIPFGNKNSIADFLQYTEQRHLGNHISDWLRDLGPEKIKTLEHDLIARIGAFWRQNSFDLLICEYTSIIPALEKQGIPYLYPFISDFDLLSIVRALQVRIELEHLRANLPAYVYLVPKSGCVSSLQIQQISDALRNFWVQNLVSSPISVESDLVCAELTVQKVRYFTHNATCCLITKHLNQQLDFPVVAGYGIGSLPTQARGNALSAVKEAILRGRSFLKDEFGNLIGPLGSEKNMVISTTPQADVSQIAHRSSLSAITVQKLLATIQISGSNKITSHELSQYFDVTIRNANRILSSLEKAGYAEILYSQTTGSKGRPTKVYELHLDAPSSGLPASASHEASF